MFRSVNSIGVKSNKNKDNENDSSGAQSKPVNRWESDQSSIRDMLGNRNIIVLYYIIGSLIFIKGVVSRNLFKLNLVNKKKFC